MVSDVLMSSSGEMAWAIESTVLKPIEVCDTGDEWDIYKHDNGRVCRILSVLTRSGRKVVTRQTEPDTCVYMWRPSHFARLRVYSKKMLNDVI